MASLSALALWVVLACIGSVVSEYCSETYYSIAFGASQVRTFHCSFGCCGPSYDEYCCISNAGIIVGIVFAGIFGLALISAIVCCFLKKKGSNGRMIRPANATTATTTTTTYMGHSGAHSNVFVVPTGPTPPAYSSVAYSTTYTNPYPPAPPGGPMAPPGGPMAGPPYPYGAGPGAPMPPAYGQSTMPPPAYSYSDPAYPPKPPTA